MHDNKASKLQNIHIGQRSTVFIVTQEYNKVVLNAKGLRSTEYITCDVALTSHYVALSISIL